MKAVSDAEAGIDLHQVSNVEDLFDEIGV